MLVIISDLHLSDGTFGSTLSHGAFQMFAGRLADMTRRASWRADGSYRPIDRIDLVLLGDVLDITRSTRWLEHGSRPWHAANETKTVECTSDIVDRILRNNRRHCEFCERWRLKERFGFHPEQTHPKRATELKLSRSEFTTWSAIMIGNFICEALPTI